MLFASTNKEQFLPADDTGHRRWLPMQIVELSLQMIERDRNQLWAEGAMLWRGEHPCYADAAGVQYADAERLAKGKHATHEQHDVWETKIADWLNGPREINGTTYPAGKDKPFTTADVLVQAIGMVTERQDVRADKRVSGVLRLLGYERRTVRVDGRTSKRWVPTAVPAPPDE